MNKPVTEQQSVSSQLWHPVRWLLAVGGGVAVGAALLVAVYPPAARLFPITAAVALFGSDYVVVAAIGGVAIAFAVVLFAVRLWRRQTETTPPVVERVQSAIHLGSAVDNTGGLSLATADGDRRQQLRAAAIAATEATEGCSKPEATARVDSGSWTTDQVASAWLASGDAQSTATDGGTATASEQTVRRTTQAITEKASQLAREQQ